MKPLYKYNKNKTRKKNHNPPFLIHYPSNQGLFSGLGNGEEDTLPNSGVILLYISEGPLSPQPQNESIVGGTASVGEAETENSTDCSH